MPICGSGCARGSSPLARGLHLMRGYPIARSVDHPRSRGVYAVAEWAVWTDLGSSPLARGLRPLLITPIV